MRTHPDTCAHTPTSGQRPRVGECRIRLKSRQKYPRFLNAPRVVKMTTLVLLQAAASVAFLLRVKVEKSAQVLHVLPLTSSKSLSE
ncbi:hypothetical protein QQF64_005779 [Cirrhinus molitorella]|uniref:Uncharacterized protein n=1 Tax=Cirrhinus molitorella TaxID=172907 RepID=A0ABR3MDQ5_9TELE